MPPPDKAAQIAHIERIERGDADGDALTAAWRAAKTLQLNLRTRMRRAVARSTSLPPKLAAEVLPRFPAEVWENPALPLLLMESPDLLRRAPARFWDVVFASPEVSPAMLPALVAGCPMHRLGMLAQRPEFDPADAPAMLQRLRRDEFVNEPGELDLTEAQCLSLCRQWHERMLDLDPALLAALRRQTHSPSVRHMLLRARQLTVTEALALIPTAMARQYPETLALAGRDDLPPSLIAEFLAREPGPVRAKVCANPSLPVETLTGLITDRNPMVSAVALLHPGLPRSAWARILSRGTATRRAVLAARAAAEAAGRRERGEHGEEQDCRDGGVPHGVPDRAWVVRSEQSMAAFPLRRRSTRRRTRGGVARGSAGSGRLVLTTCHPTTHHVGECLSAGSGPSCQSATARSAGQGKWRGELGEPTLVGRYADLAWAVRGAGRG